jgi:tRNA(His) guanylyltransferase
MSIDDLGDRMRAFEAAVDPCVLPGVWMVARLDGRFYQPVLVGSWEG